MTGTFNGSTFVGSGIAGASGTSSQSTIMGFQAGAVCVANFVTIMGTQAGASVTNGHRNTLIGYTSGFSLTSGQSNVFLGHQAGYYESGSDKFFIDNQSRTDEATSRIESLIYGQFNATASSQTLRFNANVGINADPSATLHVDGSVRFDGLSTTPSSGYVLQSTDANGNADWLDIVSLISTQNSLSDILTNGNTVPDDQTIDAASGLAYLDLRANSTDDDVELVGDNTGVVIYGSLGSLSFTNNADTLSDLTSEVNISNFGAALFLGNSNVGIDKTGLMGMVYNQAFDWNFDVDKPNYPSQASCQKGNYKVGVTNSTALGGYHTILKTDNTAYVNQVGFNAGESFETMLTYTTATADNTITLPDADMDFENAISEVLTFGGGTTGDVATLTIANGIVTARTLVP
jgi:hypothetical protein